MDMLYRWRGWFVIEKRVSLLLVPGMKRRLVVEEKRVSLLLVPGMKRRLVVEENRVSLLLEPSIQRLSSSSPILSLKTI